MAEYVKLIPEIGVPILSVPIRDRNSLMILGEGLVKVVIRTVVGTGDRPDNAELENLGTYHWQVAWEL